MKKWAVRKSDKSFVDDIVSKTDLTPVVASVLSARGFKDIESVSQLFSYHELTDPFLLKDMQPACDFITKCIEEGTSICIYGDYDCDGVTSTTVLYNYLMCLGAEVSYYIPHRDDGYGLNKKAIDELCEKGVSLIITVDNGISAIDEADYIKELGMNLIVTDHHQPSEKLPQAVAVINPHRADDPSPFKNLAGVGVVMKLIAGLEGGDYSAVTEQFSDIIAIGTVADVVPLTGENRTIVKSGLRLIENTENEGLSYLMQLVKCPQKMTSTAIAFLIAPRINAGGRFGSATIAVKMFTDEENPSSYADKLVELNNQRKKAEQIIMRDIDNIILTDPSVLNQRIIILYNENWHHGVIGIVAARITEKYGKPCFIMSCDENEIRGSARSVKGFNIFNALTACKRTLLRFGGHELAGGFSLNKYQFDEFRDCLLEYAKTKFDIMPEMYLTADKVLEATDLTVDNIQSLTVLEPFGEGNPQPVFLMIGARIDRIISLAQGKHSKLELSYKGTKVSALLFNTAPEKIAVNQGGYADLLVTADINNYQGKKSVSLLVKDYRQSGFSQDKYFSAKRVYEKYLRKETLQPAIVKRIVPTRQNLIDVYKYVSSEKGIQSIDNIFISINNDDINYCKLMLCIDIFEECGFIQRKIIDDSIEFIPPTKKIDIESSEILKKLRCL